VSEASPRDAEQRRIEELLAAQARGGATPAETEELALYVEQEPALAARVRRAVEDGELGRGWLERVERDHQVQQIEHSSRARLERNVGLSMAGVGFFLSFFASAAGVSLLGMGTLVLLYSLIRVRLKTHATDPYKDVIR